MRNVIREAFVRQSLEYDTVDIMIKSLSNSTLQQYNTAYKLWFIFCKDNNLDFFKVTVQEVLKFLTIHFNNGAKYGTLSSYRSALSLILGKETCVNDYVRRFLMGVFRFRPNLPKYQNTWDPSVVLSYLSDKTPNESLTLHMITKKVATLLALSTGQRVQTLTLIKVNNISFCEAGVQIVIDEMIKTSAPNRANPKLTIPFYHEQPNICPAQALSVYFNRTREFRNESGTERLFLTVKKPIRNASSQSISRWIKQVLKDSGIDVGVYSSHSTRHASTSAAKRAGVSVDVIKRAAGWTGTSLCFAKFYNLPLLDLQQERAFADAVLNMNINTNEHI